MYSQPSASNASKHTYGTPTRSGKIPFTPPGTNFECETAYWLWGDLGSQVPLIVLHGGPGGPGRDLAVLAALNKKHGVPVLLYDQIGCGASTHLRETRGDTKFWSMDLFLAELENVKTHLHIATFDLLGHSCGGMIALAHALTQPRGLRKLIVSSCAASDALRRQGHTQRRAELSQESQDILRSCEAEGRLDSPKYQSAGTEFLRHCLCRLDPWPPEVQDVFALMGEDDTVSYTLYGPVPMQPTGPWKDYDFVSQLAEITDTTVPGGVLLTHGRYDMSTDEGLAPLFTHIRARIKWVQFAQSSHMPHLEEREGFLTSLADFLAMA